MIVGFWRCGFGCVDLDMGLCGELNIDMWVCVVNVCVNKRCDVFIVFQRETAFLNVYID